MICDYESEAMIKAAIVNAVRGSASVGISTVEILELLSGDNTRGRDRSFGQMLIRLLNEMRGDGVIVEHWNVRRDSKHGTASRIWLLPELCPPHDRFPSPLTIGGAR